MAVVDELVVEPDDVEAPDGDDEVDVLLEPVSLALLVVVLDVPVPVLLSACEASCEDALAPPLLEERLSLT